MSHPYTVSSRKYPIPIFLFLDIDGVLNHSRTPTVREGCVTTGIDPGCMLTFLNILLYYRTAIVVISSTWRKGNTLEGLQKELVGAIKRADIHGWIPDIPKFVTERFVGVTPTNSGSRGEEICEWMLKETGLDFYHYKSSTHAVVIALDDSISDCMTHLDAYHVLQVRDRFPFEGFDPSSASELRKLINFQLSRSKTDV